MNGDQIERSLGRIEEAMRNNGERLDRIHDGLYGDGGLESRVRVVESDIKVVKALSVFISFITSIAVTIGGWIFKR